MEIDDVLQGIESSPNLKRKMLRKFRVEVRNQLLEELIEGFENNFSETWSKQEVADFLQEKINLEDWRFQIEIAIREFAYEDWMSKEDWNNIFEEIISEMGGWGKIKEQIDEGVKKGYSLEYQINIVKKLLKIING